jgi:DNA-binding MarR family transcriptional regulator
MSRRRNKRETVHEAIGQLNRLTSLYHRRRATLAQGVGFTEQQWLVLERIATDHFIPSLFARERDSSPAAVSKIIRQLVDKGLVDVSLASDDARQRHYSLTALGERQMAALRRQRERAIDKIWMALDQRELEQFCDFTGRLVAAIENYQGEED